MIVAGGFYDGFGEPPLLSLCDEGGQASSLLAEFSEEPELTLAKSGQKRCTQLIQETMCPKPQEGRTNLVHQIRALKRGACSWVSDASLHTESPSYILPSNSASVAPPTVSQAADEEC